MPTNRAVPHASVQTREKLRKFANGRQPYTSVIGGYCGNLPPNRKPCYDIYESATKEELRKHCHHINGMPFEQLCDAFVCITVFILFSVDISRIVIATLRPNRKRTQHKSVSKLSYLSFLCVDYPTRSSRIDAFSVFACTFTFDGFTIPCRY